MHARNVTIVGGGWAGLATAITLVDHQIPVTLMEAAPQLGGRARTISFKNKQVDNGQHLMIGAYHRVKQLMNHVGITEDIFHRTPLSLNMRAMKQRAFKFKPCHLLPAPLHLLMGIVTCSQLSLKERWQFLLFCKKIRSRDFILTQDISVSELLHQNGISHRLAHVLFEPLCLAALSTPASYASAEVFLTVLRDTFTAHPQDADFLFAGKDLSQVFPIPAGHYIEQNGGKILTHTRAQALSLQNGRVDGIQTARGWFMSEQVVVAASFQTALQLFSPHPELTNTCQQLKQLKHEYITTIYLQYPEDTQLKSPMIGVTDAWSQWVFDRRFADQPGLLAVVISGGGPHLEVSNKTLIKHIARELNTLFPNLPTHYQAARVIREKQGAFSCRVDVNDVRPPLNTPIPGLWLTGDYTQTGYPATLEGAIKSGIHCAEQIIKAIQ